MLIGKKYKVEADNLNVTLSKRCKSKKTDEEYWQAIGYYSRFANALKALVDLEVRETTLADFEKVCQKQDDIYKLIDKLEISKQGVTSK